MNIEAAGSERIACRPRKFPWARRSRVVSVKNWSRAGGVVTRMRGHIGAGGGDQLVVIRGILGLRIDALHLRQAKRVAAEIDANRIGLWREEVLYEAEHGVLRSLFPR